jgi:site-specific DNA-cytosine methylase
MESYGFEPGIAKREGDPNRFVEEMTPTLRAGMGDNQTAVAVIPFDTTQITSPQNFSHPKPNDPCHPLTAHGHTPAIAIGIDTYNGTESGDVAVTMTAAGGSSTHSGPKVMVNNSKPFKETADCLTAAYGTKWNGNASATNGSLFVKESSVISWDSELNPNVDKMGTLMRGGQGGRMDGVMHNMAVRRLTPMECERLQGFPDSYTDIKPKGKPTPDGPRYKALGNSMAVPVMKWIGERINQYEKGEL